MSRSARLASLEEARMALLELAAAERDQLTADLGVIPFDHPNGKPRTTLEGCHLELLDAADDDDTTIVQAPSWLVSL